jgi:two-component system sensor histidine kinase QseC
LQASFERERRFSADVAHELRTPIAELRSLSEVALKWPPTAEESRQGFDEALGIARRMESLVAALQTIARSEAGETRVQTALIRLPTFMESIWEGFAAGAQDRDLKVRFDLQEAPRVFSDPVLLESVFTNLLANAVEYTPVGGSLRVRATPVGTGTVTVAVGNDADNLTPEDVAQLFDRFWRRDLSRTDTGHSGLGLSLVRAVARTLGARVTAELKDGAWLEIKVSGLASEIADGLETGEQQSES